MKRLIEHMAVVTPVPAKNQDHALMIFVGLGHSLFDFDFGVFALAIKVRIWRWWAEAGGLWSAETQRD
jgi:hypothetical protein